MAIHTFYDTSEAYDECMCNEGIHTGDILHIEQERVVGLCDTWPIAVTTESGGLHSLLEGCLDSFLVESDITREQVEAAKDYATSLGYEINTAFTK